MNLSPEFHAEFFRLVMSMRTAQIRHYATKKQEFLAKAQGLELIVDRMIMSTIVDDQSLFPKD